MIRASQIPREVVEAAARAVCEAENGPCKCLPDECGCIYWAAHAHAAIAAALNAWPSMRVDDTYRWLSDVAIILPMEDKNAES